MLDIANLSSPNHALSIPEKKTDHVQESLNWIVTEWHVFNAKTTNQQHTYGLWSIGFPLKKALLNPLFRGGYCTVGGRGCRLTSQQTLAKWHVFYQPFGTPLKVLEHRVQNKHQNYQHHKKPKEKPQVMKQKSPWPFHPRSFSGHFLNIEFRVTKKTIP